MSSSDGGRETSFEDGGAVTEKEKIVAFIRASAKHWRAEAARLHRNPEGVEMCNCKAAVLFGTATDIETGLHEREELRR